ncbi:MAG TPA: acyl-CoA dehydrogenase family protein [Mycobacterium sp.]|nr:acyl-CoA dehydrogenase family protein [Mycobacterium sp.]
MTVGALDVNERQQLKESVRAACERFAPEGRVRAVAYDGATESPGFDRELWKVLCCQVGVTAIALPGDFGGAGLGASALAVVAHELGRALAPVPFVASAVLATGLLLETLDSDLGCRDRISRLVDGERTAAVALTADGGLWHRGSVILTADETSDGWKISGTVRHVLNGSAADDLVVAANTNESALALFLLSASAQRVSAVAESVLDGTRPMATIAFDATPAIRLASSGAMEDAISRNFDRALAVLAAEQVGACERVLEIATEYAGTREQFNRTIGSFQAIKHKCADMLVGLEWARSAAYAALDAVDGAAPGESGWRASMAKAVCSEALRDAAHANIQIHGGIGFTWEDAAHLYMRRARTDEVLFGKPAEHWDRLAEEAEIL